MNLNTCDFEHNLTHKFTDEDPPMELKLELELEYRFYEWYDIIKDIVYTP